MSEIVQVELTERQTEVLDTIVDLIKEHGRSPTVRELMDELRIASPNGVLCNLRALEKKGHIRREEMLSRSISVIGRCPVCGSAEDCFDNGRKDG